MFLFRCIPFVGTIADGAEATLALLQGDFRRFAIKTGETFTSGVLDAVFVATGGMSTLANAPLRSIAAHGAKKGVEKVATNVAMRGVVAYSVDKIENISDVPREFREGSSGCGSCGSSSFKGKSFDSGNSRNSGSGSDPPRNNRNPKRDHVADYDTVLHPNDGSPTQWVRTGQNGRVEEVHARIETRHLRSGGRQGRGYTERVRRNLFGGSNCRVGDDHVGHIVGDLFSGSTDRTYNFFPSSPYCNHEYYRLVEKPILDYLTEQRNAGNSNAYVELYVELDYSVRYSDWPQNRPCSIKVKFVFSNDSNELLHEFTISNK